MLLIYFIIDIECVMFHRDDKLGNELDTVKTLRTNLNMKSQNKIH